MSLVEHIENDLIAAAKARDNAMVAVLRLLKSSLKNEQIKIRRELSDEEALRVLQKEAKQRRDSMAAYKEGGREELAANEAAELEIIESYLPEQLNEEAVMRIIDSVLEESGSDANVGTVMGKVMSLVSGRSDGAVVSRLVRQRLEQ
jgi:uncharacterized protein